MTPVRVGGRERAHERPCPLWDAEQRHRRAPRRGQRAPRRDPVPGGAERLRSRAAAVGDGEETLKVPAPLAARSMAPPMTEVRRAVRWLGTGSARPGHRADCARAGRRSRAPRASGAAHHRVGVPTQTESSRWPRSAPRSRRRDARPLDAPDGTLRWAALGARLGARDGRAPLVRSPLTNTERETGTDEGRNDHDPPSAVAPSR